MRPIAAVAMRGGAGVVGLLTAYVSFQVWQRLEWNQRRRIGEVVCVWGGGAFCSALELRLFRPTSPE